MYQQICAIALKSDCDFAEVFESNSKVFCNFGIGFGLNTDIVLTKKEFPENTLSSALTDEQIFQIYCENLPRSSKDSKDIFIQAF